MRARESRQVRTRSGGPSTASGAALLRLIAVLIGLPVLVAAQAAQAPGRPHVEVMSQHAGERIRALQQEADELARRERTLLVTLNRLEVERQLRTEESKQIEADLRQANRQLTETDARVRELEQAVATQRPAIQARLVALYKLGKPGYVRLLLDIDDLRALGRASRLVASLAERDRRRLAEHRQSLDALRSAQAALRQRHDQATKIREDARRTRLALDQAIAAQAQLIGAIDSQRDLNAQLLGELQTAQQRLQDTLRQWAAGHQQNDGAPPPTLPFRGDVDWPVDGRVTMTFGRYQQTRFGTAITRNGIEIAAPEGTPVRAAHAGQVAFADAFTGFGYLVILDHGNEGYSLYGYLSTLAVRRGASVDRHDTLGTVGRAPTGPAALYFELRVDGRPVDPLEWLRRR